MTISTLVRVVGMCAVAAVAFVVGSAQAAEVAQQWKGVYAYEDGRPPVHFTMTIKAEGKSITGKLEEDATFGDGTSDKLFADISGTAFGYNISFEKKYDGTGGQKHSVTYRGTIDGKTMFGTWLVTGLAGTWYATAASPN